MKKNLAIILSVSFLAISILTGCSDQTVSTRVETVELDLETLETTKDTEAQPANATATETEAAVMSETVSSIPEDRLVTVQTCTEAVTGAFHYAEAYKVLTLVNEHREGLGLDALTWDESMREAAEIRAAEATLSWSHTRPNGESWYTVSDLVKGENLAKGYDSAEAVFEAWMNSDGHRENIEWEQATAVYVSYFEISTGGYWAMELGY